MPEIVTRRPRGGWGGTVTASGGKSRYDIPEGCTEVLITSTSATRGIRVLVDNVATGPNATATSHGYLPNLAGYGMSIKVVPGQDKYVHLLNENASNIVIYIAAFN